MFKSLLPALCLILAPIVAHSGLTSGEDFIQKDFDVAGVTLGMSPDDVVTTLEGRGYTLVEEGRKSGTSRGPSFNDLVMVATGEISKSAANSSWERMRFAKGPDQLVAVRFKPLPSGTAVEAVSYSSTAPAMTWERFQASVEKKYGKPRHADKRLMRWSDMSIKGTQVNIAEGAIALDAVPGGHVSGVQGVNKIKASVTLYRGKISLFDAEEEAKTWTAEPESDF